MGSRKIICGCFNIKEDMIIRCIKDGANTIEDISKVTNVGMCCGRCKRSVKRLIKQYGKPKKKFSLINIFFK